VSFSFVVELPEVTYESLQMRNRELPPLPSVYDRLTRRWISLRSGYIPLWRWNSP